MLGAYLNLDKSQINGHKSQIARRIFILKTFRKVGREGGSHINHLKQAIMEKNT